MDLIDYVGSLPPIKITPLYDNPFICEAVLRSLVPVAKQYIIRLLFLEEDVPQSIITSWAKPSANSKHWTVIETLTRLQLLSTSAKTVEPAYRLCKSFSEHIRTVICSGKEVHLERVPEEVVAVTPARELVDNYASNQWETLLLYAVGGGPSPEPSRDLKPQTPLKLEELLLAAGLISYIQDPTSAQKHCVTQAGFQFLLADTYSQLWQLLKEYIARAERQSSAELTSVLGFLLQLGFQGERPLRGASLDAQQKDIAAHMCQLGVLASFRAAGDIWLRPTRLAVLMASGSGSSPAASNDGFVVVETNSRVYAYTSSPVRQAILRLFVRCDVLLPNLFVGTITRESAMSALESGVSAEQIIGYLRQHAHARISSRVPIVPGVVADQIRLWQRELQRLQDRQAVYYKNFEGEQLYRKVAAFAEEIGVLLVRDDAKREFVAVADAHPKIRDIIKELKQKLGY